MYLTHSQKKKYLQNMENIITPWINEVNLRTNLEIELENDSIPFK